MKDKIWQSIEEVHEHAKNAVNKKVKSLITDESLKKYYNNPKNKGWIGNSIEQDWFEIGNNNRKEADIPYLGLEIKVTAIKKSKNSWSAKERLVLNLIDFNDEYKRDFSNASFKVKSDLIELIYYEYIKGVDSPELKIKAANLLDLNKLPEEDLLIIEQDWNIIIDKIKEGKAEELSDSLTKYLGATTKGSKTPKNLTTQPFSDKKAHRRAFTLKNSYMSELAKKYMNKEKVEEKIIQNIDELKESDFEDIIKKKFNRYIGKSKIELGKLFNVKIPSINDKASSATIAKKMLGLERDIESTEEFKKAGISVKILTIDAKKKASTEGLKIIIPGEKHIDPNVIISQKWEESILREYLSSTQFLLVIYEKKNEEIYFKGVKFWHVDFRDLDSSIMETWIDTRNILRKGIELKYNKQQKPTAKGKLYRITNNLPGTKSTKAIHVRPSAGGACYYNKGSETMKLPVKSKWYNKPEKTDWVMGKKPSYIPENELTDWYITKQYWWFNKSYMYQQVKEFFE
ncbi:Sau3AI family type II restriction endonuclease [Mammaliicoccus sciuri]|uniref:Sau3AI family type II restriction endonuclease n=1 Tax=Mammaliicoccus sciuri TaxID=1296 RepID=UPI0037CC4227